ncbi:Phospholipase A [Trema orientale]|uniref:Phospholipase A n=1 Tax=Trema orientale TaxID=63057 RepID=A0A2P5EKB7_TREOI|nr:Phospholipase A [Trema orientale]
MFFDWKRKPCDGLDACCMVHDACVDKKGYLSKECNQNLLNCVKKFKKSGGQNQTFKGNKCNVKKVIRDISVVMKVALLASGSLPDRHYVHI